LPRQLNDRAIKRVVEDFRSFARLHQNSKEIKTAAFLRQLGAMPFFDQTAVSQIVSDVKKNIKSGFRCRLLGFRCQMSGLQT